MARKYSGKHGKSGSKKPIGKKIPTWVRVKPKEVELLILKLAKEGKSASMIGLSLRDAYGVPSVRGISKKKITQILGEKNLLPKLPEDMTSLIKRAITIRKHIEVNKKDITAKRGLEITESKIRRLERYYKKNNRIAQDWKYDPKTTSIYLE
jgi:small subunit ribosomal protein S15